MAVTIEEMAAREEIRDVLHRYCKGIDRRDWALVRSCFADDHVHRHSTFVGSAEAFISFASVVLGTIPATHHSVSNVHFAFAENGLSVETEANFVAYHLIEAGHTEGTPVPTGGKATDWIVAGRYCDRLEKRGGQWIIVQRQAWHDWERVDPANA